MAHSTNGSALWKNLFSGKSVQEGSTEAVLSKVPAATQQQKSPVPEGTTGPIQGAQPIQPAQSGQPAQQTAPATPAK